MKFKIQGKLEVICGSMFSGKTEELIRRLRRAQYAHLRIQVFKHSLDKNRVLTEDLYAHNGDKMSAYTVDTTETLLSFILPEAQVIGIDEIQFFSSDMPQVVTRLVKKGKHVIVAGLDLDFRGVPFGCMPELLSLADTVTKLKAVCVLCGNDAHFTQRLVNGKPAKASDPIVLIGAQELYQARCRRCFQYKAGHTSSLSI